MELRLAEALERPDPLHAVVRPAAIWAGLLGFFAGSLFLGARLADGQAGLSDAFVGPILLLLGVALVGGGLSMTPSEYTLDPEIEFEGLRWYFVFATSLVFFLVTIGMALIALL